jgi:hypothetical protein
MIHIPTCLFKKLKTLVLFNLLTSIISIAQREEGIQLVSEAICAGGSNVDVCVITKVWLYLPRAAFN